MKNKVTVFLFNYAHYLSTVVFFIILSLGYLIFSNAVNSVIDKTVINSARTTSTALAAFRTLYTREVVEVVRHKGIEISHQHLENDNAIPLPATLSIELGKIISSSSTGASVFLYSPYPFPWRENSGLNDSFRKAAWEAISQDPAKPYSVVEDYNGISSVRFAVADVMRKSCVNCHNSHTDSPKVDWKVGDVRGLLEIIQPVGTIKSIFFSQERITYLGFGLLFLLFAMGVAYMFYAYRSRLSENASLVLKLEKNNKDLHVLNDELQQFAYRTSHDLKAPLLSIQGLSNFINQDLEEGEVDEAKTNVRKIGALSHKLEGTINSMLNLTKAEYLDDEAELIDFDILMEDIRDSLNIMSEQNSVKIKMDINHKWDLYSNKIRMRQVLENLVSNGIKYSCDKQAASYVAVESKTTDSEFILNIKDNGIGIPQDKLGSVFSMFSRFHPTKSAGSGLGLYLVKKHLDAMGGTISISSDMGTEFRIQFPRHIKGN